MRFGYSLTFPMLDEHWFRKIFLPACWLLVPLLGWISVLGWACEVCRRAAGAQPDELPALNFRRNISDGSNLRHPDSLQPAAAGRGGVGRSDRLADFCFGKERCRHGRGLAALRRRVRHPSARAGRRFAGLRRHRALCLGQIVPRRARPGQIVPPSAIRAGCIPTGAAGRFPAGASGAVGELDLPGGIILYRGLRGHIRVPSDRSGTSHRNVKPKSAGDRGWGKLIRGAGRNLFPVRSVGYLEGSTISFCIRRK